MYKAAYATVDHRRLVKKVYDVTTDHHLVCVARTLLENRRFYGELGGKWSR